MVEVQVARLGIDSSTNSYVVVLRERGGPRLLPIWIGRAEAEAIAAHLNGAQPARPMTHDLLRLLLTGLGGTLRRVAITRVEDKTYYAELHVQQGDHLLQVDARPSDSIALALRTGSPMLADESLLVRPEAAGDAAIEEDEDEGDEAEEREEEGSGFVPPPAATEDRAAQQLKDYLAGLRPEDFGKFRP